MSDKNIPFFVVTGEGTERLKEWVEFHQYDALGKLKEWDELDRYDSLGRELREGGSQSGVVVELKDEDIVKYAGLVLVVTGVTKHSKGIKTDRKSVV